MADFQAVLCSSKINIIKKTACDVQQFINNAQDNLKSRKSESLGV